ncbi:uncharacterized protein LOC113296517 [Papaver somniferum]|uniref:uncharacterized protein LOC113296517 n=1 Tax=Papaver somniferum TaxID=3469 RepID=UPI000E6FC2BA|nr:uncharacterized protein LOC113296517 [Papaver somniferum]
MQVSNKILLHRLHDFGARYLYELTPEDVQRLLAENDDRGFPGMLGSVDCMQWPWKNCPVAWQGTYRCKDKESSLVLQAVTSYDLWFWHAFFGMPGSNNDLNVLAHSPLFDNILKGVAPPCNYVINGHQYNMGYFLADGIYPKLTTIVQAFSQTLDIPYFVRFNKYQMDKRKDVERAFGVLQCKFRTVGSPEHSALESYLKKKGKPFTFFNRYVILKNGFSKYNPSPFEDSSSESTDEE